MRRYAGLIVGAVIVVAGTGCEPAMTITAQGPSKQVCRTVARIEGVVSPATATPRVVLQHYVGGKWSDVMGYGSGQQFQNGAPKTLRTSGVNQSTGAYGINLWYDPSMHLGEFDMRMRVRSDKSGGTSKSVYMSYDSGESC